MHRSIGVTILAPFVGIVGALGVWLALGFALPAGIRVTWLVSDLMGLPIRLVLCASGVIFAYGAWRLKPWAWTLAVVASVSLVPLAGLAGGAIPAIQASINGLIFIYVVGHVLGTSGHGDAWPRIGTWLEHLTVRTRRRPCIRCGEPYGRSSRPARISRPREASPRCPFSHQGYETATERPIRGFWGALNGPFSHQGYETATERPIRGFWGALNGPFSHLGYETATGHIPRPRIQRARP